MKTIAVMFAIVCLPSSAKHLQDAGVTVRPYDALLPDLQRLYPPSVPGGDASSLPARYVKPNSRMG